MSDYVTIAEAAELLRVKPETVRERMRMGIYQARVHYFRRQGTRPLFKRAALIAWIEGEDQAAASGNARTGIMTARGYILGG